MKKTPFCRLPLAALLGALVLPALLLPALANDALLAGGDVSVLPLLEAHGARFNPATISPAFACMKRPVPATATRAFTGRPVRWTCRTC
jgi:hypothetical protein